MSNFRAVIKNIFYKAKLTALLDYMLFRISQFRNKRKNAAFRKANPDLVIPSDYFLYETYRLDYSQFYNDGEQTAREINDWTKQYLPNRPVKILDWGCGVGRAIIHLKKFVATESLLYGCDVNQEMIEFDKRSFKDISFNVVPFIPPTSYESNYFDLVYAISIFTHIKASMQQFWVKEIHRILMGGGVYSFLRHKENFLNQNF